MGIQVTRMAFSEGQPIPQKYSGQGDDISPPLNWSQPPAGAKSLAPVVEDPDAPLITFTHRSVYNLPPDKRRFRKMSPNPRHCRTDQNRAKTVF